MGGYNFMGGGYNGKDPKIVPHFFYLIKLWGTNNFYSVFHNKKNFNGCKVLLRSHHWSSSSDQLNSALTFYVGRAQDADKH